MLDLMEEMSSQYTGQIFKYTIFVGYGGVIFFTGVAPNTKKSQIVNFFYRLNYNKSRRHGSAMISTASAFPPVILLSQDDEIIQTS